MAASSNVASAAPRAVALLLSLIVYSYNYRLDHTYNITPLSKKLYLYSLLAKKYIKVLL